MASTKERLSGERAISIPTAPRISCMSGICAFSENLRDVGELCPGLMSGPASRDTMTPAAMKLNMMVVMTTWLPR